MQNRGEASNAVAGEGGPRRTKRARLTPSSSQIKLLDKVGFCIPSRRLQLPVLRDESGKHETIVLPLAKDDDITLPDKEVTHVSIEVAIELMKMYEGAVSFLREDRFRSVLAITELQWKCAKRKRQIDKLKKKVSECTLVPNQETKEKGTNEDVEQGHEEIDEEGTYKEIDEQGSDEEDVEQGTNEKADEQGTTEEADEQIVVYSEDHARKNQKKPAKKQDKSGGVP